MKRACAVAFVMSLAALLPACYLSEEPLETSPGSALDGRLLGSWKCADPETKDEAALWVVPFDRAQYFVEWREPDDLGRYRAYPTRVGDRILLNVSELEPEPKDEWIFVGYTLPGSGPLTLTVVSRDALEGLEGRRALDEIRRRAADDSLYEPLAVCTRQN